MGWIFLENYGNTKNSINNLFNLVKMLILGIETSCDETAAAVVEGGKAGTQNSVSVRSNIVSSQIDIHKKYGGVVPEVAAREHVLQILPVVNEALGKAGIKREQALKAIDAIAVTVGPGLITSLLVGVETAKVLSYVWNAPVIPINHIEGHIYANFIGENPKSQITNSKQIPNLKSQISNIEFPAVILTVSGGHTMLVLMKGHGKYKTIGETRDDAAGEAFDKAAKLLGLGYPGGPEIAKYAEKFLKQNSKNSKFQITNNKFQTPQHRCATTGQANSKSQITNSKQKIVLPRPMLNSSSYDFSFSGLKTALMYKVKKNPNFKIQISNYCAEFQQAVIDVLISKTIRAAQEYKAKTVILTGGVAANKELRKQMEEAIKTLIPDAGFLVPELKYTTDNAAMIAAAGYWHAIKKDFTPWQKLRVDCNLEL